MKKTLTPKPALWGREKVAHSLVLILTTLANLGITIMHVYWNY